MFECCEIVVEEYVVIVWVIVDGDFEVVEVVVCLYIFYVYKIWL